MKAQNVTEFWVSFCRADANRQDGRLDSIIPEKLEQVREETIASLAEQWPSFANDILDDFVQEAIVEATKSDQTEIRDLSSFVYLIAHRNASREWRKRVRRKQLEELNRRQLLGSRNPVADPLDYVIQQEQVRAWEQYLDQLDEETRTVLDLHYIAGHSYKDIAESLGKTEAAVRQKAHRAIHNLRQQLIRTSE